MNFQQLRTVREAVRSGFNLTEAAQALHTSQPGVSRQIRELEQELGITLFTRFGKRLTGLTPPGAHVLPLIERLVQDSASLRQASRDFAAPESGLLRIGATHAQARYAMPEAVQDFRAAFPLVRLQLQQGSPQQVAQMLAAGDVDVGIATEALARHAQLVALPCYRWTHCVVVPPGHALLQRPLTLQELARHPLITYCPGFSGRTLIDAAFARAGLEADVVLAAMDADVVKTYVALGMGVGVVATIAFDPERDGELRAIDAGPLFGVNVTRLAVRRGDYLRRYVYAFIEAFAPTLTADVVDRALLGEAAEEEPA